MFMEVILSDNKGSTESIQELRSKINSEIEKDNSVLVKLLQPGVMYEANGRWNTVVDFMNEWKDKPVTFQSNLVPIKHCDAKFEYTNDMFFTGPDSIKKIKNVQTF